MNQNYANAASLTQAIRLAETTGIGADSLGDVLLTAEVLKDYLENGPDGELVTDVVLAGAEDTYGALNDAGADLFFDNFGPDDSYYPGDTVTFTAEDEYSASPELESAIALHDAALNDIERADAGLMTFVEAEDAAETILHNLLADVHGPLAEILYDRTGDDEVAVLTYVLTGPRDRVLAVQDAFRQTLEAAGQRVQ